MGSKVATCKQCGKLFQTIGSVYCSVCVVEMDEAFKIVKDYLYDHRDATVVDVIKGTGVSEKYVLSFLKEGRLDIESSDEYMLKCEDCSKPIPSGRYCLNCRNKLANVLERSVSTTLTKEKDTPDTRVLAKMHSRYGRDKIF